MDFVDGSGLWTTTNNPAAPAPSGGEYIVTYRRRRRMGIILLPLLDAIAKLMAKGHFYA